jgi:hypothetical protein
MPIRWTPQIIAAVAPPARSVSVRLDLDRDADQIKGSVEHADGRRRPFWSWLELIQELEAVLGERDEG